MHKIDVIFELKILANPEKAALLQRFFKTGKGEYAQGDIFLGVMVPEMRKIARKYQDLPLSEVEKLLQNKYHEVRLCALIILAQKSKVYPEEVFNAYLANTKYINNWDLVDLSAPQIVGCYLFKRDRQILYQLVKSKNLWERRIAVLATFYFIKFGEHKDAFKIAELLLDDKHDLIHKAVGWMLREVGNRISIKTEEEFLDKYAAIMPRTMLRYALEKFLPEKRQHYLGLKKLAATKYQDYNLNRR